MLNNQNTFQNAGQHGSFWYLSVGNLGSNFLSLVVVIILLRALLLSEERYRKLLEDISLPKDERIERTTNHH